MNIIIYEDENYRNFLPLTWTRAVYNLRCGINTLAEKVIRQYPKTKVEFSCRYYLGGPKVMKFERGLFINGRVLAHSRLAKEIPLRGKDEIFYSGDEIVAIRAVGRDFEEVRKKAKVKKVNIKVLKYPWELIIENSGQLAADKKHLKLRKRGGAHKSVVIYNSKEVVIEAGAEIEANVVIDARPGAVYVGRGTIIRPQAYLRGPLSIGPECRIGGEVTASIFHGYSNKAHCGFIGHSYIGEWVNLGAGTTNSNLKNNYGTVKVAVNNKAIDTGERFAGCFVGDHAKTGIGTLITTGAVIGVGANVFGGGVTPKVIPSFSWGTKEKYDFKKAIETARMAASRRKLRFSAEDEALFRKVYQLTS